MDYESQIIWAKETPTDVIPKWDEFESFMDRQCQTLESVETSMVNTKPNKQFGKSKQNIINTKSCFVSAVSQVKPSSVTKITMQYIVLQSFMI